MNFRSWDNLWYGNAIIVNRSAVRNISGQNGNTFQYRVFWYDYAWNVISYTSPNVIRVDTQPPLASDITNNNSTNLLATNNYSYRVTIWNNGGAPISSFSYQRENSANESLSPTVTDNSAPWIAPWNISLVDNYRLWNGARSYSFRIRTLCDQAGNCNDVNEPYSHNVYANTLSMSSSMISNSLSSPVLADGIQKNIVLRLRDQYWNIVIPATWIGRTIDFNIRADNNLRLNQYNNNGTDSALFVWNSSTAIPVGNSASRSLNNRSSTTWDYDIPFYVYAPTTNQNPLVSWSAQINSISYDINRTVQINSWDNPQSVNIPSINFPIQAWSIYSTMFGWEIATQWLIEWAEQNSSITFNYTPTTKTTSNRSIYFEFWSGSYTNNTLNSRFNFSMNDTNLREGYIGGTLNSTVVPGINFIGSTNTVNFRSFLSLENTTVDPNTNSYLASILRYRIDWKNVIYPSGIIWKQSYYWAVGNNNTYQWWVRILWNTSSSSTGEIVTNQFSSDVRILWNITKSSLKKDIETKVYSVIKNIAVKTSWPWEVNSSHIWNSTWSSSVFDIWNPWSRWTSLFWDKVLYFSGWTINVQGTSNIWGSKTIVVKWWNLRIRWNILDPDNDGILWIIVLWWDIYIDTTVTDIHAVLYTNRSIRSYSPSKGLYNGSNLNSDDLWNQLYIQWSIFSENTIGWSKKSTHECPYYVEIWSCTDRTAQAYDLNYLRRYYIYDSDNNGIPDARSWSKSVGTNWDNERYPVVIEYNPAIQQTPPPFFE